MSYIRTLLLLLLLLILMMMVITIMIKMMIIIQELWDTQRVKIFRNTKSSTKISLIEKQHHRHAFSIDQFTC